MKNIVLIGMPGTGKSTVGNALAERLNYTFVDLDDNIKEAAGKSLPDILRQDGLEAFFKIEEAVGVSVNLENSIIATGGSVVYGEDAMRHLKDIGTVIYLKLSYEAIEDRLGDLHARGVTIQPGWTLLDLYNERVPLYEKWADITVDCEHLRLREVVEYIRKQVNA